MEQHDIFRAIADPTRRSVLEKLTVGEMNATQLRDGIGVSQPAISQHLAVLRGAGMISERRVGRHVLYRIEPDGLRPLVDWIVHYRAFWPARVEKLKILLKEMDQ